MKPSDGMRVIGLTGGIACGKTTLAQALAEAGAPVIDADAISRALTAEGGAALPAIRAAFGDGVFQGDALDRRALAALVFAGDAARKKLEDILHPLIFTETRARLAALEASGASAAVLDVPLLYETGMDAWCDEVWCAYVPKKEQLARLMRRDGLTRKQALARVASQMPGREKARRADRVVRTDGDKRTAAAQALALWRETAFTDQRRNASH